MRTLLSVCSARPNFVKLAAVHHALQAAERSVRAGEVRHVIVHTGQHYDPLLSDVFFQQLKIPQPEENLGVSGGTREEMLARTEEAITPVLARIRPDIVLVYGDVNGALAASTAAKKLGLRIAHVEAGLRSGDLTMPEEHNRIGIDRIADLLFVTEESGMEHLRAEGVPGESHLVGNTMIDTILRMMPIIEGMSLPFMGAGERFAIATLHRPSNVDNLEHLERAFSFLNRVGREIPVILPVHPRTSKMLAESGRVLPSGGVFVVDPLGYLEFIRQMKDSAFVLTDSGGIQEETVLLKKRCFTLRKNTERPVTIACGSNTLIDIERAEDRDVVLAYVRTPVPPRVSTPPLWDGKAGERIVEVLLSR